MNFKYFFISISALLLIGASGDRLCMLYNSLEPKSIRQHLTLYALYPEENMGKKALTDACRLLQIGSLSSGALNGLISLMNHSPNQPLPSLTETELEELEALATHLAHKELKGHRALNENAILALSPSEIDLARGLFLSQMGNDLTNVRLYEALIDCMALEILNRLTPDSAPEEKIHAINRFLFKEKEFKFPPHAVYSQDIDLYTFLPSVLDTHKGVCLGVSILYLCIGQRLGLELEMVTPPGHIYLRLARPEAYLNIETTARGIHLDSEEYLGINTCALQTRNIKEVIGLAHFNQASVFWQRGQYEDAYQSYEKAKPYLPDDPFLKELSGYVCLLTNRKEEGKALLTSIRDHVPLHHLTRNTLAADYLDGNVDTAGIEVFFCHTKDDHPSLLAKKKALEEVLERCPAFRAGQLHLALTWLQLGRAKEALELLKRYHQAYPEDPEAEYYLAVLYLQRMDYLKAWKHLHQTERLLLKKQYYPKILQELRHALTLQCAE